MFCDSMLLYKDGTYVINMTSLDVCFHFTFGISIKKLLAQVFRTRLKISNTKHIYLEPWEIKENKRYFLKC